MGRSAAIVKFDDGTLKYTTYQNTSDILCPRLFDNITDAFDAYHRRGKFEGSNIDMFPEHEGEGEHVLIWVDYGGCFWWEGTATRDVVIGPIDYGNIVQEWTDGRPDWAIFKETN